MVGGPILAIEMRWGPVWRERRRKKVMNDTVEAESGEVGRAA